jgi:hypothetical protein
MSLIYFFLKGNITKEKIKYGVENGIVLEVFSNCNEVLKVIDFSLFSK